MGQRGTIGDSCLPFSAMAQQFMCCHSKFHSFTLLLYKAQRTLVWLFASQVQQSRAVRHCVLIHKPDQSDMRMAASEYKHGPFCTLTFIRVLVSVLSSQRSVVHSPESSVKLFFFFMFRFNHFSSLFAFSFEIMCVLYSLTFLVYKLPKESFVSEWCA